MKYNSQIHWTDWSKYKDSVIIRINAAALIKFLCGVYSKAAFIQRRRLFEGGVYSKAALIRGRRLFEVSVYSSNYGICNKLHQKMRSAKKTFLRQNQNMCSSYGPG